MLTISDDTRREGNSSPLLPLVGALCDSPWDTHKEQEQRQGQA